MFTKLSQLQTQTAVLALISGGLPKICPSLPIIAHGGGQCFSYMFTVFFSYLPICPSFYIKEKKRKFM